MIRPQTQCPGCKRTFSLNGYSQHVSKTRRAVCRAVHLPGPRHPLPTGCAVLFAAARAQLTPMHRIQADPTVLFVAAHRPPDPDVSAPSQAMNGTVSFLKL